MEEDVELDVEMDCDDDDFDDSELADDALLDRLLSSVGNQMPISGIPSSNYRRRSLVRLRCG